jgi:Cft2 family RNA processing exonuclease
MRFLHLGREQGIGANSYLLESGETRVVLDAGLHPKREGPLASPNFGLLADGGAPPTAAFLTHSHQDHVGSLPILTRLFPQVPVFMTPQTARIADTMLHNSVNVMGRQREERGQPDAVLFTHRGVEMSRQGWQQRPLGMNYDWRGERLGEDAEEEGFCFHEAGHILGSAGVTLRLGGRTVFYTGDVHFRDQTLMQAAQFPKDRIDVLIMETTRGDSPTDPGYTREGEKERLACVIRQAVDADSSVTIPVFALGKTQELLAMVWEMKRDGQIPHTPIYIGGLSTKITEIYDSFCGEPGRGHPDLALLHEVAPYVVSGRDIDSLRPRKRCLFALSSGMLTENTLSNIFVRRILEDPRQHLAFVGYSDPESPAGKLRAAAADSEVILHERLPALRKRCQLHEFNFSAHAPREDLLDYAIRLKPATILLVHGDPSAQEWFRQELARHLPETRVHIPLPGEALEI